MRIEHYQFGKIVVEKVSYRTDIALTPTGMKADWRRMESHLLARADIAAFDLTGVQDIVVGSGAMNMMKVASDAYDFCVLKNINLHVCVTAKAVELYNRLPAETTVGLFHITC
jgi:hypothetical protein